MKLCRYRFAELVLLWSNNSTINANVNTQNRVKYRVWHTDPWPNPTRLKSNRWHGDPVTLDQETRFHLCPKLQRDISLVFLTQQGSDHPQYYQVLSGPNACYSPYKNVIRIPLVWPCIQDTSSAVRSEPFIHRQPSRPSEFIGSSWELDVQP